MKFEKYKLVYFVLFVLIILVIGLYFRLKTNNFSSNEEVTLAYTNCTILDERARPNQMLIWGRVVEINKDDPEWIISTVELCDNLSLNPKKASINVYMPTAEGLFYSGKKFQINGKQSYQWKYKDIQNLDEDIHVGKTVVIRSRSLISKEAIYNRFKKFENFNCEKETICYPLIDFIENYNGSQIELIKNIKTKNTTGLLKNSHQNKNIVYSNMIGTIDSYQELQEYSDNLIIW